MTLILGLASKDGLLLVSDSQTTYDTAGQQVKLPSEKIFATWNNLAWGAASDGVGIVQHVRHGLETTFSERTRFRKKKRYDIRKELVAQVVKDSKAIFSQVLQLPGTKLPLSSYIFVGCAMDGPFIVEVHPNMTDTDHTAVGYAATGSGDIFPYIALASLKHFNVQQRTLEEAKLIAYRIVQDAISVAAQGIGPPIQMIEIPVEGDQAKDARKLDAGEMRILDEKVIEWKVAESEVLTQFVGLTTQPPHQAGESMTEPNRDEPPSG